MNSILLVAAITIAAGLPALVKGAPDDSCNGGLRKISVGAMKETHFPRVLEIEQQAFEHPWARDEFESYMPDYQKNPGKDQVFVAKIKGNVVGYIVVSVQEKGIEIANLAVAPEFKRQGVATQLIDELKKFQELRHPDKKIFAVVRKKNPLAQLFFIDMGFTPGGKLENYYDETYDPEPAFTFEFLGAKAQDE